MRRRETSSLPQMGIGEPGGSAEQQLLWPLQLSPSQRWTHMRGQALTKTPAQSQCIMEQQSLHLQPSSHQ